MVSVIITTKNEAVHLPACLTSIKQQTYTNLEIIVVDNHSKDKTKEIAKKYTPHVFDYGPERSAQRNFGAKKARGEYLLFLDADMELSPNVVKECIEMIKDRVAIVIPEKSFGLGFWAKCKDLERQCYEGVEWMEAARFYTKEVFINAGRFDQQLTGPEDFEFAQRVKARFGAHATGRIDSYILHNEGNLSLAKLLQKKYYYGMRMARYRNAPAARGYFQKQSNIFLRFWLYLRHPNMFFRDPIHYVGMVCMKTAEMGALALGGV